MPYLTHRGRVRRMGSQDDFPWIWQCYSCSAFLWCDSFKEALNIGVIHTRTSGKYIHVK